MGSRTLIINENFLKYGDQDANSVLIELDKGLRSAKMGEQCEAIIRFPKLFEKYPCPVLINSSFLKLAEFFRIGSNLSRLWVLRVCQQSEKHLEKILNVEEFVKRVFMVIHSNDPVARALTLRTLGSVACVIPEKQQVHHSIRNALDSHDIVEIEAAIYASVQFAAQSKSFAIGMCSKVASMIESLQTPVSMKILLIPVLRHMYHDANTAALVRTLCRNLLPKYPSEQFVIAILQSLSHLSYVTFVDIPDQVALLLLYLNDPRRRVQYAVLHSLNKLARKGAYLWSKISINKLLKLALQCSFPSMTLDVIITLTDCATTCSTMLNDEQDRIIQMCKRCLTLEHSIMGKALTILTRLVTYCASENISPPDCFKEYLSLNLEYLIHSALHSKAHLNDFRVYLKCGINLAKVNHEFRLNFAEMIAELLVEDCGNSFSHLKLMCETLGAICSNFSATYEDGTFKTILLAILKKLETYATLSSLDSNSAVIVELLASICLQAAVGSIIPERIKLIFSNLIKISNCWTQYRIARSASRYGHHFLAATTYKALSQHVSIENLQFYLIALCQISKAECILNYGIDLEHVELCSVHSIPIGVPQLTLLNRIEKAIDLYTTALSCLDAASAPQHPKNFQSEVINLRCHFLQVLHCVVVSRNVLCITPPSAISNTLAQNLRDPLQKYGHVTNQLRKNIKIVKSCEEAYNKLYKSSFDADPCSLEYLETMQYMCSTLQTSIESISFLTTSDHAKYPPRCTHPETKYLLSICNGVSKQAQISPNETGSTKSITNKHMDILLEQIEIIVKSGVCIPRFFFQILQNTSVKLALTPQPRLTGEPILVQPSSNLVIKVEGVILHCGRIPSFFRAIERVQLTLSTHLMAPRLNEIKGGDYREKPGESGNFNQQRLTILLDAHELSKNSVVPDNIVLTQILKPHHEFLSGNFLLSLQNSLTASPSTIINVGGQWQITLETCIIDQHGFVWITEPKSCA
ncbi:integrator complex subunit 7 isoform X2 [Wyeomyia smithii]|uniref:integrator complex subunit 7 isoform X2 n=1 Tax=Wyeomyia smithii TaxID=174621 RepID=UPI002467AE4B|nr:integrator complex subunit 7 isoform X2 [Wyeomyia smithii]